MENTSTKDRWHCLCNQGFVEIKCFLKDNPEFIMDCNFCPECGKQLEEDLPTGLSEWINRRKE
jgi:hypothetical protein